MDPTKKHKTAALVLNMTALARIHRYYLAGFEWLIEPPDQVKKSSDFIFEIETILLRSGYMTQAEIDARHRKFIVPPA